MKTLNQDKTTFQDKSLGNVKTCHHCGHTIIFNRCPDKSQSHWAHAVTFHHGKEHSLGNALMHQRCSDGRNWATPARKARVL